MKIKWLSTVTLFLACLIFHSAPVGADPTVSVNTTAATPQFTDITFSSPVEYDFPPNTTQIFKVDVPGGIWDLHIFLVSQPQISVSDIQQNLFPNKSFINGPLPSEQHITLDGAVIPQGTFISVTTTGLFAQPPLSLVATVPEPSTIILLSAGLTGWALFRQRLRIARR